MDEISSYILPEYKDWFDTLSPKLIADIINGVAIITKIKMDDKKIEEPQNTQQDNSSSIQSNIPAIKGLLGELHFETIFHNMSSEYTLENVSKTGKSGDFNIKWTSGKTNKTYKIMIDIKNYKNTVPSSEIDKFYRDININNVDGGLLLSLKSRVVGMHKIVDVKDIYVNKGLISIMMIHSNTPIVIIELIKLLFHIIELKDLTAKNIINSGEILYRINQMNELVQLISISRDILQSSKDDIDISLNNIHMKLMTCEINLAHQINNITNLITESYISEGEISDELHISNNTKQESTPLNEESKTDISQKEQTASDTLQIIKKIFNSSINIETNQYLESINKVGWDYAKIIQSKKYWVLFRGDKKAIVAIKKNSLDLIVDSNNIEDIVKTINTKNVKKIASGTKIIIDITNIDKILNICKLI